MVRKAKPARSTSTRHRSTPDALAKIVGARIRLLRKELEWSFDAFVEETGLGRGYISELERGLVVPTITTLGRVARALEVTMADLLPGTSSRERLFMTTRSLEERDVLALLKKAETLASASKGTGSGRG